MKDCDLLGIVALAEPVLGVSELFVEFDLFAQGCYQ